jgi:hypothetical protein
MSHRRGMIGSQVIGAMIEDYMKRRGKCLHFRGIHHDTCLDGVNWKAITGDDPVGIANRMPCFSGNWAVRCLHYCEPTQEDLDAQDEEWTQRVEAMARVTPVVNQWRSEPPVDKSEVVECPLCNGWLHLVQSCMNGRVHGRCETAGCVSWLE